jgi:hypothetical protein
LTLLDETIREAHGHGLFSRHAASGEEHVQRVAMTDQSRQPKGASIHQRDSPTAAVDSEDRIARRDPKIAPQCQLQSSSDRVPFDRRDHWLGQEEATETHRTVAAIRKG